MLKAVVGVLAALGTAMAAMAGLVHGHLIPIVILSAAAATGLADFLALPGKKMA
jgi:hypothetical protein